ncbi:MAG TPA: hypothetical protein VGH58_12065 [Solirubrobacterales bacterium]|jgi:hypothetical protein
MIAIRRFGWAVALAAAMLAAGPNALALAGLQSYRSTIERVTPRTPGISAQVRESDDFIVLSDRGGHEATVYGYEGEPYARILDNGTVQVNRRSPAAYLDTGFSPTGPVPAKADPKAPPQWRTRSHDGSFAWFDHRTHYLSAGVPPQVTDASRKTKVFDYEVPLRIDGHRGAIHGTLFWAGSAPGPSKLRIAIAGLVVLFAGGALVLVTRHRRRGGKGGGPSAREREPAAEAW